LVLATTVLAIPEYRRDGEKALFNIMLEFKEKTDIAQVQEESFIPTP
jgi:hypothetical protein